MDFLRNYFVVLLALILIFVLNVSFTLGDYRVEANYDFENYKVLTVKQARLQLECNSTSTSSSNEPSIKWFKEGTLIKSSEDYEVSGGKLLLKRPSWNSVGNYSCLFYAPNATEASDRAEIYVIAKPYVKIHPNQVIAIEGEELKVECSVYGRPTPRIMWKFIQFSSQNETMYTTSEGRVTLTLKNESDDLLKAYFIIKHARMDDRGDYICIAQNVADHSPLDREISKSSCFVRIKDKYAALWPFLGICVEVVVLCAVIFIYEKKRNKAELEESDTDQSPEQKNTPDHGKESVRQRK